MSATATVLAAATGGDNLLEVVVTAILSGSVTAAIATLITSRAVARKTQSEAKALDAKLPAEVDSVVVQGAEAAVLTMGSALASSRARIADLERERSEDRARIADLERRVDELRRKVDRAERALSEARDAGSALRSELESFRRDQARRR